MSATLTLPPLADLTLPPLADAMTAADLYRHSLAVCDIVGGKCEVYCSPSYNGAGVQIYPQGICGHGKDQHIYKPTWPEAFEAAYEWARNYAPVQRNALIRRMALAVIQITDEHGKCTVAMLRHQKFEPADIEAHHVAACERAGEMCKGAPFSVLAS